ncbi:YqaJ viral recombinase family protein [Comamonas kerstersii]|uniref:YqaJ viral recombinase family protein n=1 Tax=Comamonas kerstersii TaxID=225992 RepID=UPI001B33819D|nr:YqaJ viral recombinase family protein [Comamonas kerstersii]QTW20209.1 YqaJ viral recombinase family protein [Comamonas kerstersii]
MIITERTSHHVQQGTTAWLQLRSGYPTASEAPAAQGVSRYMTRSELLRQKATGITPEHDDRTLARFAEGHRVEELARPLAEAYLGEELSNVTMTAVADGLPLLASLDGINFDGDISWECKLWNEGLAEQVRTNNLSAQYTVQMDQQQLVSGAKRTLFTCTDGTPERTVHCWYESTDEKKAAVVMHWRQFLQDVAAYDPAAERPAQAVAAPMESLPAVVVQVQGALTVGGNLDAFGDALRAFIERIPKKPSTDQEFADAEAAAKALKKAEEALATAEDGALAQISDVEQMRRTVADLKNLARTTRLATEKLVAAEKEARKQQIVLDARKDLDRHIGQLERRLEAIDNRPCTFPVVAADFAGAIKGLKSLDSMRDKVAVTLTNAKHEANVLAQRLEANRKHLVQDGTDWIALFADFATVGAKAEEDFQILAAHRIGQHKQAEAQRLEAERERIRAEEAAKLQAQAAINAAAATQNEAASAQQEPFSAAPAAETKVQSAQAAPEVAAKAEGETLTLGQLNTILAPIKVDTAGLADLGFTPCKTEKSAKHYPAQALPAMVQAMIAHLQSVLVTA